jgi:hypothetical protein
VAAHGLHYGLIAIGFVLVVALLWSSRARARRYGTEDDARHRDEHDRRVSELRQNVRTGRLGLAGTEPARRDGPNLPS